MEITRTSMITGATHTREVNCTPEQIALWESGTKIQDAMPDVPAPLREYVKSGITPEEWRQTFGPPPSKIRRKRT